MKQFIHHTLINLQKWRYLNKCRRSEPGSAEWLLRTEIQYGGRVSNVPRNKVSPKDPRTAEDLKCGGMIGGDRMLDHGYAAKYSEYLLPYIGTGRRLTVVEFGILKGTGLAIWCDLFKEARVLGFDIDLGHIESNMDNLKRLGAFGVNRPELYEFDQFIDNTDYLRGVLHGDKIDICIDDGYHSAESILSTIRSVMPFLANNFVYFVEDNAEVHRQIRAVYPDFKVDCAGELTIVSQSRA